MNPTKVVQKSAPWMIASIAAVLAVAISIAALFVTLRAAPVQFSAPEHHLHIIDALLHVLLAASFLAFVQGEERVARYVAAVIVVSTLYVMFSWALDLSRAITALNVFGRQLVPLTHTDIDQGLMIQLRNIAIAMLALTFARFGLVVRPFAWSLAFCTGLMSVVILFAVSGRQAPLQIGRIDTGIVLLAAATVAQTIAIIVHASRAERNMWLSMSGFTVLILCGVLISAQSRSGERRQLRETTAVAAREVAGILAAKMHDSLLDFQSMFGRWQALQWRVPEQIWASDVELHIRHFRDQSGIVEFDAHGRVLRGVLRDPADQQHILFSKDPAAVYSLLVDSQAVPARVQHALAAKKSSFVAGISKSPRVDEYIRPLLDDHGNVLGAMLVQHDSSRFVTSTLQDVAQDFNVRIDTDGEVLYDRLSASRYESLIPLLAENTQFQFRDMHLSIDVWPTDLVIKRYLTPWSGVPMLFAWGAVVLYAAALQFSHRSRQTAADRERILQQSLDLICTVNRAGNLVTVSAASTRLFGYIPAELVGKAWLDMIHPVDRERASRALSQAVEANPVSDLETRCLRKERGTLVVQWSMRWSDEAQMFYGVARDVTESRLNQLRVRAREEVFRRAAEFTSTVVVSWENPMAEPLIVGAVEKVFGAGANSAKPGFILTRIHPDDVDAYVSMRDSVLTFGGSAHGIYRLRMPDGSYGSFDVSVINWKDAQSGVARNFVTLTDSTQREIANRERRRYTEQLAALAELARSVTSMRSQQELCDATAQALLELVLSRQAVIMVDAEGAGERASYAVAFAEPFASAAAMRPGAEMSEIVASTDKPVRLAGEEMKDRRFWRKDGGEPVSDEINGWLAAPIIGRDGTHVGSLHVGDRLEGAYTVADEKVLVQLAGVIAVALENISLYGQLEDRVAERTRELELSNRELEAFSYSVSHDLRAPLRAIGGFSGLLQQDHAQSLAPQAKNYLERIEGAVKRMADLIDDLLGLARVSRIELSRAPLDISSLVQRIVEEHRDRSGARQIEIRIDPDMRASGDARLMNVVFENLIQNALKFTGTRPVANVHIGQRHAAGESVFFVSDNGVGFDPAHATNLFGVFQRLHSVSEFPGTGVGLAIVHRIIQRHHGRIWADAQIDRGATFYFTIGP